MLEAWRAGAPWARLDPRRVGIVSSHAAGPLQVVLRSVYETRGVRYELRPAPSRTLQSAPGPDPWSSLPLPADAPIGAEVTLRRSMGLTTAFDCARCGAIGESTCHRCGGRGSVSSSGSTSRCPTCNGRGQQKCTLCGGSGGVLGDPSIWARLDSHEEVRWCASAEPLPDEISDALHEAVGEWPVLQRVEARPTLDARDLVGFRSHVLSPQLLELALALLAHPGIPDGARLHAQILEVRQPEVIAARLASGTQIHVWGDPVRVHPSRPLLSWRGRLLPFLAR